MGRERVPIKSHISILSLQEINAGLYEIAFPNSQLQTLNQQSKKTVLNLSNVIGYPFTMTLNGSKVGTITFTSPMKLEMHPDVESEAHPTIIFTGVFKDQRFIAV